MDVKSASFKSQYLKCLDEKDHYKSEYEQLQHIYELLEREHQELRQAIIRCVDLLPESATAHSGDLFSKLDSLYTV